MVCWSDSPLCQKFNQSAAGWRQFCRERMLTRTLIAYITGASGGKLGDVGPDDVRLGYDAGDLAGFVEHRQAMDDGRPGALAHLHAAATQQAPHCWSGHVCTEAPGSWLGALCSA